MRILLPTWGEVHPDAHVRRMTADSMASSRHSITESPRDADAILFTQCHFDDERLSRITGHPLFRAYPDKCYVYHEGDLPTGHLAGLYCSLGRRRFLPYIHRAVAYYDTPHGHEPDASLPQRSVAPDLLFSLVASRSHPCREPLLSLRDERAVIDDSSGFYIHDPDSPGFEARRDSFPGTVLRSRFVLCPRGRGTSSYRLYETMRAGRVPVIVSDDWVPPSGPDWSQLALVWPEYRITGLVDALLRADARWSRLAYESAAAFDRFFSREARFDYVMDQLEGLVLVDAAALRPGRRASIDRAARVSRRTAARVVRRTTAELRRRRPASGARKPAG